MPCRSMPSRRTADPPSARTKPVTASMIVVLPAPFGPIRPTISPGRTSKVTPSTATTPPNRTVSASIESVAGGRGAAPEGTTTGVSAVALDRPAARRGSRCSSSSCAKASPLGFAISVTRSRAPEKRLSAFALKPERIEDLASDATDHEQRRQQRPTHVPDTADHHEHHDRDRQEGRELGVVDGLLPEGEEAPADRGDRGPEPEREQLRSRDAHPEGRGGALVVAHGDEPSTDPPPPCVRGQQACRGRAPPGRPPRIGRGARSDRWSTRTPSAAPPGSRGSRRRASRC